MYQVLLAEDEIDVLDAMVKIVAWEDFGFNKPVACRDGREAIAVLKDGYIPDVIITDICMPLVDGLEVANYAKEHIPEAIVILLSGYDDFSYAQKAVQMRVHDYILKPVTPRDIHNLLEDLASRLDQRENSQKDSAAIMRTHFLNKLVTLQMDKGTIQQGLEENKLHLPMAYYTAIVMDVDLPQPANITARKHLELMRYGLHNIAQELTAETEQCLLFSGQDGRIKGIIGGENKQDSMDNASKLAVAVNKTFESNLEHSVSAGIGSAVENIDLLHDSHSQAREALSQRFFQGSGSIIFFEDNSLDAEDIDYLQYEKKLQKGIVDFDQEKTVAVARAMTKELESKRPAFDRCVFHSQKLMTALIKQVRAIVDANQLLELEKYWDTVNFYSVFSLTELENLMVTMIERAFVPLVLISGNPATVQMIQAEQFIQNNYSDPTLSLNTITEYLAVSTSYFSSNFKSRTGSTFVEYLTKLRMERAKDILSHTSRRTYEVAAEVGYSDPHYFSSSFKKVVGVSPKEYRETHKTTEENP